jgi:redox-sensitive bicupin YhaK (pirin superfamily)
MILNHAVNVGGFLYCATYQGPHTTYTYFNDNDGHYHRWLYMIDGSATVNVRNTNDITEDPIYTDFGHLPGTLIDVKPSQGKYVTTTTNDIGLSMLMFNPIPATRELTVEIVKGTVSKTITASEQRITLICINGPITVNDKTVESLQHVKVFPGKTVTITLPEHTVCALVQDK